MRNLFLQFILLSEVRSKYKLRNIFPKSVLLTFDDAVNSLNQQFFKDLFGPHKTITPKQETFDTLLKKRKAVKDQLHQTEDSANVDTKRKASGGGGPRQSQMEIIVEQKVDDAPTSSRESKPTQADSDDDSTTSRLLRLKRKQRGDQDDNQPS